MNEDSALPLRLTNPDIGILVDGRYALVELVGEGGQAQVYRGVDTEGGPDVAVKVLRGSFASDAGFRERFSREAAILRELSSPAALRVYGESYLPDQRPALITELLTGRSLGQQLTHLEASGHKLPIPGIMAIMASVTDALEEAHGMGVIHRDLKPDNLFLLDVAREGTRVKLLDFGFAKFLNKSALTADGTVAGSPRYIAPEAWFGERNLTAAFDVYSMGAVIYHCLTGQAPFPISGLAQLLTQVTTAPRPRITAFRPDLPPLMDAWVERSLAIERTARFSSVREQFDELKRALG